MTSARVSGVQEAGRLRLRLYVAGQSPNSSAALANLRSLLAEYPAYEVDLEVIDVLRDPDLGLRDGITVTPMLLKSEPPPERRLLGSLRDRVALLGALGIGEPQ